MHITVFLTDEKYSGRLWSRTDKILPSKYLVDKRPHSTGEQRLLLYKTLEEFWHELYTADDTFCLYFGVSELPNFTDYDKVKEIVDIIKDKDNIHLSFVNDFDIQEHKNWDRELRWQKALQQMPQERIEFVFNNTLTVEKFKQTFPNSKVNFGSRFIQRFIEGIDEPYEPTTELRNKHFLCLNSRPVSHRDTIYNYLKDKDNSYLSYRLRNVFLDEDNPWNNNQKNVFTNDPASVNDIEGNFAEDLDNNWQQYQDKLDKKYYNDACVYVCTETAFGNISISEESNSSTAVTHWWTEKVLKSFYYKLPLILIGSPFILESCKSLGFKTFDMFWDESYDNEIDNDKRMQMLLGLLNNLSNKSIQEVNDLYYSADMQDILNHNLNTMFILNDKYTSS